MNSTTKKIMIYSLAGIMQLGIGASVIEASPLHSDDSQQIVQLDRHDDYRNEGNHFEHEKHERERAENERYKNEMQNMKRHFFETYSHFHKRQDQATERHERTLEEIRHEHHHR